jgi:hypothetical protein
MQKTRLAVIIIISVLAAAVIYLSIQNFLLVKELNFLKANYKAQQTNEKAAAFAKLFVDKILLSSGTINFEDRLQLENSVRNLADKEIFEKWQQFTASKGDAETQKIVGGILELLINKIK